MQEGAQLEFHFNQVLTLTTSMPSRLVAHDALKRRVCLSKFCLTEHDSYPNEHYRILYNADEL
jgi:hypothetical protein